VHICNTVQMKVTSVKPAFLPWMLYSGGPDDKQTTVMNWWYWAVHHWIWCSVMLTTYLKTHSNNIMRILLRQETQHRRQTARRI